MYEMLLSVLLFVGCDCKHIVRRFVSKPINNIITYLP